VGHPKEVLKFCQQLDKAGVLNPSLPSLVESTLLSLPGILRGLTISPSLLGSNGSGFSPVSNPSSTDSESDGEGAISPDSPMDSPEKEDFEGRAWDMRTNVLMLAQSLYVLVDECLAYEFDMNRWTHEGKFSRVDLLKDTLLHWVVCSRKIGWMAFLKYKCNAFFASSEALGGLPIKPFLEQDNPAHLVGGTLGRFIQKTLLHSSKYRDSFLQSVLLLKKGCPRPSPMACLESGIDTYHYLTTEHPVPPFFEWKGKRYDRDWMAKEIERSCKEVFGGHTITYEDIMKPLAPSFNSNVVKTRAGFGAFGVLVDDGVLKDTKTPPIAMEQGEGREESMYSRSVTNFSALKEQLNTVYSEIYLTSAVKAMAESPDVELISLPEPLKIRTISKGPPYTYFVLQPVQQFLHKIMRKHPCFKLIGETINAGLISDALFKNVSNTDCKLSGDDGLLSVDYKGATDSIDPYYSDIAVKSISEHVKLPPFLTTLFHRSLTGHNMSIDPILLSRMGFPMDLCPLIPQKWGQLMGSVMSFIILCILNFAVLRATWEIDHGETVIAKLAPVIVNGDDGGLPGSDSVMHIWKGVSSLVGFQPSVGKVYWSKNYINMNSTGYRLKNGSLKQIPYVNMGLVTGLKRSGGSVSVLDEADISVGARHHELMKNCINDLDFRGRVHGLFSKYNKPILKAFELPWFIPENLGGYGLMPIVGYKVYQGLVMNSKFIHGPSKLDLMIASDIVRHHLHEVKSVPSRAAVIARSIWQPTVQASVVPILREETSLERTYRRLDADSAVRGFLDIFTIYTKPSLVIKKQNTESLLKVLAREGFFGKLNFKEKDEYGLFDDEVTVQQIRVLRKNERVWRKLLRRAQGLEKALPLRDLSLNAVVLPLMDNNQKNNQWAERSKEIIDTTEKLGSMLRSSNKIEAILHTLQLSRFQLD
jgi:hypothetical protein